MTAQPALFDTTIPTPAKTRPHGLPDWLADHIHTTTGTDPRSSHRRAAHLHPCPHCRTWTIRGLDADLCARPATATAQPLTTEGAAVAILAGLTIWHLHAFHGRLELNANTSYRTQRHRLDLVAEHACHIDLTAYATASNIPIPTAATSYDVPPF